MDESNTEKHQRPSQSELDNVSRGSIVKVSDPDKGVWYWVIIERRLDNHHFFGRIDARCMIWPALRHGGRLTFHQDHILYIWPRKVDQVFDSAWFRHLSHVLSFGAGTKVVKRPTPGPNSVRHETRFTRRIKGQLFIGAHNETPSAASMRVSNEECSPTRLGHTFRPIHVARCIVNMNHDIM